MCKIETIMLHVFCTNLNTLMFELTSFSQGSLSSTEAVRAKWKRAWPNITEKDLCLLTNAGEVTLRLHNLPLTMIISVANFLFPSADEGKSERSTPLEWLILTALYRQIDPDTLDTREKKALCERAIKDSELAVLIAGECMAYKLTQSKNARYIMLIAVLGTNAQKTHILLHLLEALFGEYSQCKVSYGKQDQAYHAAYTDTRKYYYFIKGYYSFWVKELEKKPARNAKEQELVDDYPKYLSNAEEILKDCEPKKNRCVIC